MGAVGWNYRIVWGEAACETGKTPSAGHNKKTNPGHEMVGARQTRAQALGSPALGIVGKAAGVLILKAPELYLPRVH